MYDRSQTRTTTDFILALQGRAARVCRNAEGVGYVGCASSWFRASGIASWRPQL